MQRLVEVAMKWRANIRLLMLLAAAVVACGRGPGADADSHEPSEPEQIAGSDTPQGLYADKPEHTYETLSQRYGLLSDQPGALEAWVALAQEGYAPAQLAVGAAHALGKGVSRDEDQAITWLRKAAEAGNATAQYDLSLLHMARAEFADAYEWSSVAARRGGGRIQEEAARHRFLLALVLPAVDRAKAERSATDWLADLPEDNSVNNLASDQQLAFAPLAVFPPDGRVLSDFGWRDIAQWIQTSAQASLRAGKMLR